MSKTKDIIIIGGGVIGRSCAYYLTKEGHSVTIIDASIDADILNCSHENAGYVCPSHFIPMAAPGVINSGLKWMLDPQSPFFIPMKLKGDLLSWLWKFYKASSQRRVDIAVPVLLDLGLQSRKLYIELSKEVGFDLTAQGLNILCKTSSHLKEELEMAKRGRDLGLIIDELNADDFAKLSPHKMDIAGGIRFMDDAHLDPRMLMAKLQDHLKNAGVQFIKDKILRVEQGYIGIISVGEKRYKADEFILAGGVGSTKFAKQLGINIPIQPGKGYTITVDNSHALTTEPTMLIEGKVALTPFKEEYRIAGTMELGVSDRTINANRIAGIKKSVKSIFPEYDASQISPNIAHSGLRPCSPDGMPFIGRSKKVPNLTLACGHSILGVSLAAITGKLVNDIISDYAPSIKMDLLSPERF